MNIEDLIAEIQGLQQSGAHKAPQRPGGGFQQSDSYNSPGAVSQWLWGNGYSGIGPMANNAPPIVRQALTTTGMKLDPTQYRSVGGYTPHPLTHSTKNSIPA
jgi:hypothetical protein